MQLKLGDFGLAVQLEHEGQRRQSVCGTANYVAPEVLNSKGYGMEVDIWAVGVIMYTLLYGKSPFATSEVKTTYRKIKANSYEFPESIKVSTNAKILISNILTIDPLKRPTLDQILADDFFQEQGIPEYLSASTLAVPPGTKYKYKKGNINSPTKSNSPIKVQNVEETISPKHRRRFSESCKIFESLAIIPERIPSQKPPHLRKIKSQVQVQTDRDRAPASAPSKPTKPPPLQIQTERPVRRKQSARRTTRPPREPPAELLTDWPKQVAYIVRWIDYTSKYGLGYYLSNMVTGVSFNDGSKILLYPDEVTY